MGGRTRSYPIGPEWFEGPLGAFLVNADWRDAGVAGICAIRRAGGLVYGFCYLVDVYGLGLKDCYPMRPLTEAEFKTSFIDRRLRSGEEICELDPRPARSLVWGGVHTAQRNGFRPPECHSECGRAVGADPGWKAIEPGLFGKDGKVCIVGAWEDIGPRMIRPHTTEEAMDEWNRRGFVFLLGPKGLASDAIVEE